MSAVAEELQGAGKIIHDRIENGERPHFHEMFAGSLRGTIAGGRTSSPAKRLDMKKR
jgi:hypothetical protein